MEGCTVEQETKKMGEAQEDTPEFEEKLIRVRRVFTVVKGGRRIGFNALVVVGNRKGQVGIGLGKAKELVEAIGKGRRKAESTMAEVVLRDATIPHQITGRYGASRVLLKPASPGTGIVAGEVVRTVSELAGIRDLLTKSLGSNNPLNVAKATLEGLKELRDPTLALQARGKGKK